MKPLISHVQDTDKDAGPTMGAAQANSELLEAALSYAARDWWIIPCHDVTSMGGGKCSCRKRPTCPNPGKHPRIMDQFNKSSTDPDTIRDWWDMWPQSNIGIDCGRSNLLVIDVDVHNGKPGLATWADLVTKYQLDTNTPTVQTGSGGQQLYYGQRAGLILHNTTDALGPGVDTRGAGGLVIAPPGRNAAGPYTWLTPLDTPVALLPEALALLLAAQAPNRGQATAPNAPPAGTASHPSNYGAATIADEITRLLNSQNGTRNHNLNTSAFRLGQLVAIGTLDRDEVEQNLLTAARALGLDDTESLPTIRSGLNKGTAKPRPPADPPPGVPPADELPNEKPTTDTPPAMGGSNGGSNGACLLLSANDILKTAWPKPVVIVPQVLTAGLGILAGAPKLGKSWLGLQTALGVASGGQVLGYTVEPGPVLYLALEDPPRRLQERMIKQGWPLDLPVNFITIGNFAATVGDLLKGGAVKLSEMIEAYQYRLIVVDTLSRAITGDQMDVEEMTRALTPLQGMAHKRNCAVWLFDHHRKVGPGATPDAIADILGSTAKGAMADTVLGLYRERGKAGAKLTVTGREIAELTLALTMDWDTGTWQNNGDADAFDMTDKQQEIVDALTTLGRATLKELADATGQNKGSVYKRLADLITNQVVKQQGHYYVLA